jgi:hypothetical protein
MKNTPERGGGLVSCYKKYAREDSNLQLPAPEAGTLSIELRARVIEADCRFIFGDCQCLLLGTGVSVQCVREYS